MARTGQPDWHTLEQDQGLKLLDADTGGLARPRYDAGCRPMGPTACRNRPGAMRLPAFCCSSITS